MERQVPRRCRQRLIVAFAAAASVALCAPAFAGATAAIVWNQIIAHATQLQQYARQVQTAQNSLQSVIELKSQLQQLNPETLLSINGGTMEKIDELADLNNRLIGLQNLATGDANTLRQAAAEGSKLGLTPAQYLQDRAKLAQDQGGAAQESYQQSVQRLAELQSSAAALQRQLASSQAITSQVGGLQALNASSGQIEAQMIQLNNGIQKEISMQAKDAMAKSAVAAAKNEAATVSNDRNLQTQKALGVTAQTQYTIPNPLDYAPASTSPPPNGSGSSQ